MAGGSAHEEKRPADPVGWWMAALYNFPKPTIAMVNGLAVGAGVSLALGCELRVASDQAKLMPAWLARGFSPDAGTTWLLPRLVGYAKAASFCTPRSPSSPRQRKSLGYITKWSLKTSLPKPLAN